MSFARYSTDDYHGIIRGYTGEGAFTSDPLDTFGGAGVAQIPSCRSCSSSSAARASSITSPANFSDVSKAVHEAATRYMGWDSYLHGEEE